MSGRAVGLKGSHHDQRAAAGRSPGSELDGNSHRTRTQARPPPSWSGVCPYPGGLVFFGKSGPPPMVSLRGVLNDEKTTRSVPQTQNLSSRRPRSKRNEYNQHLFELGALEAPPPPICYRNVYNARLYLPRGNLKLALTELHSSSIININISK